MVVVDRDAAYWREQLNSLHSDLFGPAKADSLALVQLEVIDRATDETIQRLIAAGLLSKTARAARTLYPSGDKAEAAPLSDDERARAKSCRERAARKLKMAQVLGEGGFDEEARKALLEAIPMFAGTLAVEHRLPEPTELKDALQSPLSHHWSGSLPVLRAFAEGPGLDWKPVAECLARV